MGSFPFFSNLSFSFIFFSIKIEVKISSMIILGHVQATRFKGVFEWISKVINKLQNLKLKNLSDKLE